MQGSITIEMHFWSALVTILVTAASAAQPEVESLRSRILANLGMAELPDMSAVNTSDSEMQKMMREYEMRVRRDEEEILSYDITGCINGSYVMFRPELSNDTNVIAARFIYPDRTIRDVSEWVRDWRTNNDLEDLTVPCDKPHCCQTRLQLLVVRRPSAEGPTCGKQCCRVPLKITFKDLGWDWVLYPKEFEAFYCKGSCRSLTGSFASNHAIVQDIISFVRREVPLPCCVPKKLKPQHLVHYNNMTPPKLVLTKLSSMIVEECMCA